MKIAMIERIQMIGSKLIKSQSAHSHRLLRVKLGPLEEPTATEKDGPDEWQDDGAVGMRGWYY